MRHTARLLSLAGLTATACASIGGSGRGDPAESVHLDSGGRTAADDAGRALSRSAGGMVETGFFIDEAAATSGGRSPVASQRCCR